MTNLEEIKNYLQNRDWCLGVEIQEVIHKQTGASGETIARACRKLKERNEIFGRINKNNLVEYHVIREMRLF